MCTTSYSKSSRLRASIDIYDHSIRLALLQGHFGLGSVKQSFTLRTQGGLRSDASSRIKLSFAFTRTLLRRKSGAQYRTPWASRGASPTPGVRNHRPLKRRFSQALSNPRYITLDLYKPPLRSLHAVRLLPHFFRSCPGSSWSETMAQDQITSPPWSKWVSNRWESV